ncbi:hypothetical protein SLE2022_291880 [Rubroshorea leprosula]
MAIPFSTRTIVFHHLASASRKIPSFPNHKIQFLSTKSTNPPKFRYESHNKKQFSLVNLLQRYGFPPSQFSSFLEKNKFLLKSNLNDVEKSLFILSSFGLPKKSLVSLVSDCPGVLGLEFLKKWQVICLKVGDLGVSPLVVRNVLEISRRFQIEPDRCLESLRVLKGLRFSACTASKVLDELPELIMMKESEILWRIEFLVGKGIPRNEIERIIYLHPGFLQVGAEDRLKLLFEEFQELGFSENEVCKEIVKEPRILGMELGKFSRCVQLLRTLKCRIPIKEKIFSEGAFRAAFDVKLRVDCLCKHGLTGREAFKVLWKEPRLIVYNIGDIEKKIEFLVNRLNCEIGCLVEIPEYLGVNFDKQIVPRFKVIDYLKSKGALGLEVGLRDLIRPSRLRFYNLYVKPYPGCEKMFGRFIGDVEVQRQHLVGLRKLFKPQRYTDSKEDVKNMKSFVESLV